MSEKPSASVGVVDPAPLWNMLGGRMPRGLLGLSDPDVHRVGDQWVMFIGGFSSSFRNRLYRATLPSGVGLRRIGWTLDRSPVSDDPPRRGWDAGGMHTPSYVPRSQGRGARIYYAGRSSSRHYGPGSEYAIGVLSERSDGRWERHPAPVLRGWEGRPSVLEPLVIAADDGYRMWFLATPHEVGRGEQPDFELHVTDSVDGIRWKQAKLFSSREDGFFDNAVYPTATGWEMILARGTNLHGTRPYPEQGLWLMRSSSPSVDRADWSAPEQILDTEPRSTPPWMGRGVCGPTVAYLDNGNRAVFFTGTHTVDSWWQAAKLRLVTARRLPVPSPYFLATGSAVLTPEASW